MCRKFFIPLLLLLICSSRDARAEDTADLPEAAVRALSVVRPEYPYEARYQRITGSGIAVIEVDSATGKVTRAYMAVGTGSGLLDTAATQAFKQWRFPKGAPSRMKTPITFTMTGSQASAEYAVKSQNMDNVLAAFLGKGTVVHGPIPDYPRHPAWTNKSGKGVFELHGRKDGSIEKVRILKSSGDGPFDRAAVKTLEKWKLRRGPLILELPLSFTLTPTNYSVNVSR